MALFDLTGKTTRPVPGTDYSSVLKDFLLPGQESIASGSADAGLAASALESARAGENADRLGNDPGNPVLQARGRQMLSDESLDPYSDVSSGARQMANQSAADTVARFMDPNAVKMRQQQISEGGQAAEANARGTGTGSAEATTSLPGKAAADQDTAQKIKLLEAQFGIGGGASVDNAPVHTASDGSKWIDASAIEKKSLPAAMKRAADQGIRLVTDKQTVQQLQDVDTGEKNLDFVKQQLASKLPADAINRPEKYAANKLSTVFQSDPELTAFFRTLQPMAMQVYRTAGGMKGAGGMRMGPAIANIANGVMPNMGDTVGTMNAILDDLHRGLANVRSGSLGGVVGGQAGPHAAVDDGLQHFTQGAAGNIVPFIGTGR